MKNFINKEVILWDFDGVLMDSMPVRDRGFEQVLKNFPKKEVRRLMEFHRKNGGLSRYVKFRYFFEEIRKEQITDAEIKEWASRFSKIMLAKLGTPNLLIQDTFHFVKANHHDFAMHIVSGSDGQELREICHEVGISPYFKSIEGSPTPKKKLVGQLLKKYHYNPDKSILIGDSFNDVEAATTNHIAFLGYNNPKLKEAKMPYVNSFANV